MNITRQVNLGPIRGRGLVATRKISPGEILFTEYPLVCCQFAWNKLYGYSACDYCLCPLETSQENIRRLTNLGDIVLPYSEVIFRPPQITSCANCSTLYCSQQCLQLATDLYHKLICLSEKDTDNAFMKLDEVWRQSHYPPESSNILLLVRIVSSCISAYVFNNTTSQNVVESLSSFVSETVVNIDKNGENTSIFHNLLGEKFVSLIDNIHKAFIDVLLCLARTACSLLGDVINNDELLQKTGLSSLLDKNSFSNALCLIGRNGQGIATSPFSLWVEHAEAAASSSGNPEEATYFQSVLDKLYNAAEEHVGSFLDNEGVGLYLQQSSINHSCLPNAVVKFTGSNNCLSLLALEPIQENEEITISYLDPCLQTRSRHSRRKYLASHYLFWCECSKCEVEKLDETLSETSSDEMGDDDDEAEGDDDHQPMDQTNYQ